MYERKNKIKIAAKIGALIILISATSLIYTGGNDNTGGAKYYKPSGLKFDKNELTVADALDAGINPGEQNIPKKKNSLIKINGNYKILECPDVLQDNEYTCGVWAGLTALGYYGITQYADVLAAQMKTNPETGTEMEDIARVLRNYGLKATMRQMTIMQLKDMVDNKIPVIVMLQAYDPNGNYSEGKSIDDAEWGHYVTVIGYGEGNIVFKDPDSFGKMYLSEKDFGTRWKGTDAYNGQKEKILLNYGIAVFGKRPEFKNITSQLERMP